MPEDKTSLTKPSVQGSDETTSSRQPAGKQDLNDVDENGVPWKNRAEEQRKKAESMADKLDKYEARIAELEEKDRLTQSEKAEKKRLEDKADNIEAELHELDTSPNYKAFRTKLEKTKHETVQEAKKEFYAESVQEILEDALDLDEEFKDLTVEKLRGEIKKRMKVAHMELTPTRRTKVLLREYKNELKAAKANSEKKDDDQFTEANGRAARETSVADEKSITGKARKLGLI